MPTTERPYDRGTWLGERRLRDVGTEFRNKRNELGLSQAAVAKAARISRSTYSRIERGKSPGLTVVVAARVGAMLGLDLSLKTYPGGQPLRDEASAKRIKYLKDLTGPPLRARTEVPLPQRSDHVELRRWDLMLTGGAKRTGLEFEARLYDAQAQVGRWNIKLRDDPVDAFVVVLADTQRNRQAFAQYETLFADFPRIGTAAFLAMLRSGTHPPTGLVFLENVQPQYNPEELAPGEALGPGDSAESGSGPAQK
jgi:transcriptional regulator with XRE-family HTH domain